MESKIFLNDTTKDCVEVNAANPTRAHCMIPSQSSLLLGTFRDHLLSRPIIQISTHNHSIVDCSIVLESINDRQEEDNDER